MMLDFTPIPIFSSNYLWLFSSATCPEEVIAIDPGAAEPLMNWLKIHNKRLKAVFITHSHNDHIAGLSELISYRKVPVFGPRCNKISQVDQILEEGSHFFPWQNLRCEVMALPGHLPEHIVYLLEEPDGERHLIAGDIIFSSGCGRIFDGTPEQLFSSLQRIAALPDNTKIYCAHEYTLTNCHFAATLEPDNADIQAKLKWASHLNRQGICTLPTTVANEKRTNPFLRGHYNTLRATLGMQSKSFSDLEVFTRCRNMRNSFQL